MLPTINRVIPKLDATLIRILTNIIVTIVNELEFESVRSSHVTLQFFCSKQKQFL